MNIAVIGTTGFVGSSITQELVAREHSVLGIARNINDSITTNLVNLSVDIADTQKLADALKASDVVVSAFNAGWTNPNIYDDFLQGAKVIQEAVKLADVKRFIVIGGAGSLHTPEGTQLVDTPDFPKEYYPGASAARDYFNYLKQETDLDWVFFSPAIEMHQGITTGRTGQYRLGNEAPVFDQNQRSILSVQDLAVVIADEIENPKHHQQRFTAAY